MQVLAVDGAFNMLYIALPQFKDALTPTQFAWLNGGFAVVAAAARLVQQWVAVTPAEKEALIVHAQEQPAKIDPGNPDPL